MPARAGHPRNTFKKRSICSVASAAVAVANECNVALLALSCELLGVMEKAQEITFDYLRIRKQFQGKGK